MNPDDELLEAAIAGEAVLTDHWHSWLIKQAVNRGIFVSIAPYQGRKWDQVNPWANPFRVACDGDPEE